MRCSTLQIVCDGKISGNYRSRGCEGISVHYTVKVHLEARIVRGIDVPSLSPTTSPLLLLPLSARDGSLLKNFKCFRSRDTQLSAG